ncbi:hypothetical protein D3C80_1823530 [compost metagenome]
MAAQPVTLGQLRQALAMATADLDPVVGGAFQEVHGSGIHRQQFGQQCATQAKACALWERIRGHGQSPAGRTPPWRREGELDQFFAWLSLVNSSVGTFLPLERYWLLRNV